MKRGAEEGEDRGSWDSATGRLDSWKEIAAYLKRSVRTVQRWERESGLPVYRRDPRLQHGQVFTFKSELDAWWKTFRTRARDAGPWWSRRSLRIYAGLGGAALALILATGLWFRYGRTDPSLFTEEQLAAWRFVHGEASPDGRWFVYREPETGYLWLRDLLSQNQRLLVGEWVHEQLAWSRDGTRIAFVGMSSAPRRTEVLNVRTGARRIIREAESESLPPLPFDWTPDGTTLLCRSMNPGPQMLFLQLEEGQAARTVRTLDWRGRGRARVSPDGRFLAYPISDESGSHISLRQLDGTGEEVRLTDHPAGDIHPVWSPDGRFVLFSRQSSHGKATLMAVEIDRSSGRSLGEFELLPARQAAVLVTHAVTPKGELIEVRRGRGGPQAFLLEVDPLSGRPIGPPKETFPEDTNPEAWSSDGRKLYYRDFNAAFGYPPNWRGKVYVERDVQSGRDRMIPLLAPAATIESFYWEAFHPDTRRLLWTREEGNRLHWHDEQTGETGHVDLEHSVEEVGPVWSPDARSVLFPGRRQGSRNHELIVVHLNEKLVRVLASGGWMLQGAWSRDGRRIAYTDVNCLKVVEVSGGLPREIVCSGDLRPPVPGKYPGHLSNYFWFNAIHPSWSPDGRRLAWTTVVPEMKRVELWIVDAETGEKEVAFAGETDYYSLPRRPLWSPSGRHIAFAMNWYPDRQIWRMRQLTAVLNQRASTRTSK